MRSRKKAKTNEKQSANEATVGCNHGCRFNLALAEGNACDNIMDAFVTGAYSDCEARFKSAIDATKHDYIFWNDSSKLELVLSFLLAKGSRLVLDGDLTKARIIASVSCYFQDFIAVEFTKNKSVIEWRKIEVLHNERCDQHTLVSFFRKRIPCSCLEGKYEEVKSITMTGLCHNRKCPLPGRIVERKALKLCSRCRQVLYCSKECQRAEWPVHKCVCKNLADLQANNH
eukprot:scaffold4693_cov149-Skeletonema_menzelii.AAC.1